MVELSLYFFEALRAFLGVDGGEATLRFLILLKLFLRLSLLLSEVLLLSLDVNVSG